ncbi:immunoglobulin-like domain-containing protein, partial [Erysipelothrix urinaevulpis]
KPVLNFESVTSLAINDAFDPMENVSASDIEDGDLSDQITIAKNTVDTSKRGVYAVEYSVTDSDDNTVTGKRTVLVGYNYEDGYAVNARFYSINKDIMHGTDLEILKESGAEAWFFDIDELGNVVSVTSANDKLVVKSKGNYADKEVGTHEITIGIEGHTAPTITINVLVTDSDTKPGNGDRYTIISSDFTLTIKEATEKDHTLLIDKGNVVVYDRETGLVVDESVSVIQENIQAIEGTTGTVTYHVNNDEKAISVSNATVDNLSRPELEVVTPIDHEFGKPFDYLEGVKASDLEDDANGIPLEVTYDKNAIDVNKVGIQTVEYSVTDSDNNTVKKTRVVVVNDGRFTVEEDVVLLARNFAITLNEVTGTDDEIIALSNAKATRIITKKDGSVEFEDTEIIVKDSGKYPDKIAGDHTIILGTKDSTVEKQVIGKVINKDVVVVGDKYIITANDFLINQNKAESITDEEILNLSNAEVLYRDSLLVDSRGAKVDSHNIEAKPSKDNPYMVTISSVSDYKVKADIKVHVDNRNAPNLDIISPISVELNSTFDYLDGVSATDVEDDELGIELKVEYSETLDTSVSGIQEIPYWVTDSDHNTVRKTRVVIVNDGNWTVDNDYILYGRNFAVSSKKMHGDELEVLRLSKAYAYRVIEHDNGKVEIDPVMPTVSNLGTYGTKMEGIHDIKLGISGNNSISKTIKAKVYTDDNVVVGDQYLITSNNFEITTNQAKDVDSLDLVSLGNAKVFTLDGFTEVEKDAYVVEHNIKPVLQQRTTYMVVYGARSEENLFANSLVSVYDDQAPILNVTTPIVVDVNGTFDYMNGVDAIDKEDGNITNKVTHQGVVDTKTPGIYRVNYHVVDSDGNEATASRVVVVNDGSYIVKDSVIFKVSDFEIKANYVTGTDTEIIERSNASAYSATTGEKLNVSVALNGGYTNKAGKYSITLQATGIEGNRETVNLTATVTETPKVLPPTGLSNNLYFYALITSAIGIFLVILAERKEREEEL